MKLFSKWLPAALCLAAIFPCRRGSAQSPEISANRVLFVVETSRAMRLQLPAARDCVQELVGSGLNGQLHAGDTIGLWTYDSELHAGVFPMQVWTDDRRLEIAQAAGNFLSRQKTWGKARLDLVLPEILRVIGESDAITVLLISDGQEAMQGTPFDDSINEVYQQHRKELHDARLPFVTVLVARAGKIVKCNVNSATGVNVPVLPQPIETKPAAAIVASHPVPPPAPSPVRTNLPLIMDYSKSNLPALADQAVELSLAKIPTVQTNEKAALAVPVVVVPQSPAKLPLITNLPTVYMTESNSNSAAIMIPPPATFTNATPSPSPETNLVIPAVLPPLPLSNVPTPAPIAGAGPQKMETATAQGSFSALVVCIAVAALLLIGGLWLVLVRRRTASRTGGSLITKSFDQKKH